MVMSNAEKRRAKRNRVLKRKETKALKEVDGSSSEKDVGQKKTKAKKVISRVKTSKILQNAQNKPSEVAKNCDETKKVGDNGNVELKKIVAGDKRPAKTSKVKRSKEGKNVETRKQSSIPSDDHSDDEPESKENEGTIKKKTKVRKPKPEDHLNFDYRQAMDRTVFVGNAALETNRRSIEKLFKKFGDVEAVYKRSVLNKTEKLTKKMFGTDSRLSKVVKDAFFYVRFKSKEDAEKSLQLNGTLLDGHNLRVTLSVKKQVDNGRSIFVGNLKHTATEQDVFNFFREQLEAPESVRIVHDVISGLGKGIGFVTFRDISTVPLALNLNGSKFKGRELRVTKIAKKKDRSVATAKEQQKKRTDKAKKHDESNVNQKIAHYTIRKEKGPKKTPKKVKKVIVKKKKGKSKPKSLLAK